MRNGFRLAAAAAVWLAASGITPGCAGNRPAGGASGRAETAAFVAGGAVGVPDAPAGATEGGFRGLVYSRSLGLLMGFIFLCCWGAQSIAGRASYNVERLHDLQEPLTWLQYVVSSDFWNRTLQNWQSELLAVGSMAIFAVFLRQRGSSESKPVGAPHEATGVSN